MSPAGKRIESWTGGGWRRVGRVAAGPAKRLFPDFVKDQGNCEVEAEL